MTEATRDTLLDGRVVLRQPAGGLRATSDAVLLAAAVRAGPVDHILDMGCGTGAATFCLTARVEGCRVTGLEADKALAALAATNAALNEVEVRVDIVADTLPFTTSPALDGPFDHVMTNPPYLPIGRARRKDDTARDRATVESVDLATWLGFALDRLRPRGTLTVVHRADRLDDLLDVLSGPAGDIAIFPLWSNAEDDKPARRVLVRARKGVNAPLRLLPGLVMHDRGGGFSKVAETVLRDGKALAWP